MNCKIGFLFILIMLSGEIFAQEKWYKPVDIGQHIYIDSSLVKEEKLSKAEANKIFGKDTISSKEFFVKMNALRDSWLKLYEERYKQKFYTAKYFNKEKDFRVTYQISKFSNSQAKIYVIFTYGHYMWHHYHVLLKEFLIELITCHQLSNYLGRIY